MKLQVKTPVLESLERLKLYEKENPKQVFSLRTALFSVFKQKKQQIP